MVLSAGWGGAVHREESALSVSGTLRARHGTMRALHFILVLEKELLLERSADLH